MENRVVVTGMGAITPIGNNVEEFWNGIKEGKCGIDKITAFDTTDFEVKLAAESEEVKSVEAIEFGLPCQVELENLSKNTIEFIPYHENFKVEIAGEDKLVLETKVENEVFYYLLQANKDLKVSVK